ncbi:MAG: serine/threonine-protein kinase [Kofleriaceae bacterium]
MADWIGRTLDGRYAVESILGQGGMGVVLRAHHKFTGAQVAVKMLRPELHLDPQLESRFLAEARASNQIGHPAIVQVLDAGRTPEGELYLVMELLAGQSMRDALKRTLPPGEIRRIARELLDALAAAHGHGFVHRDLKPENVFLAGPDASVKLLDFGIAKGVKSATIGAAMTQAGVVLGTLAYMAPEQLHDASTVDPRADLWAIGVMIYEMLAGRLPYPARTIEDMFVMLARDQPDPISKWIPTVAPAIEQFFARALARAPDARFGSAAEMAAAVAQLPLGPIATPPPPRPAFDGATAATGYGPGALATAFAQTPPPQTPQPPPPGPAFVHPDPTGPHPHPPGPGRNIAIVAGVAAVVAIALGVLIASQHHAPRPPASAVPGDAAAARPAAPVPGDAAIAASPGTPIDAAAAAIDKTLPRHPAAPRDAGVLAHDGGVTPRDGGVAPLDPYANDCAANCSFLGTCGLRSQNCLAECAKTNGYHGCVTRAAGHCDAFAACFLATGCGPVGRGTASCSATLDCQLHCSANDKPCACRCASAAAPSTLSEWLAYNTCITSCGGDQGCAARQCTGAYHRCKAR